VGPLKLHWAIEKWPLQSPFRITGYTMDSVEVLVVSLEREGRIGRGEAAGVYYRNDRPETMVGQLESVRPQIEGGIERTSLQRLMPRGGARNALDCALWDLEAKLTGRSAWQIAGLDEPKSLLTTFTCGADDPGKIAAVAQSFPSARAIKVKLTGEPIDADRVRAIRAACQDVWLGVDANQGLTRESLNELMPVLLEARVALIEQPFCVGQESLLDGLQSPIPIAADESVQDRADLARVVGRFNVINIKLDKCGGLTEGIAMARAIRHLGLDVMVGNMMGTSLAMAPAYLVGQLCHVVDLDGPALLRTDRQPTVEYSDGHITCPDSMWGC
jgi:L-Ala-D/L-Glu epimerase